MTSILLENLTGFLSTEKREEVFLQYMLEPSSPTDVSSLLAIPFSSVDRITNILATTGIITKIEEKDRRNIYFVNWNLWIHETLKTMNFDLDEEYMTKIEEIIKDKLLISFVKLFSSSDVGAKFIIDVVKEINPEKSKDYLLLVAYASKIHFNMINYPLFLLLNVSMFGRIYDIFETPKISNDKKEEIINNLIQLFNNALEREKGLNKHVNQFDKEMFKKIVEKINKLKDIFTEVFKKEIEKNAPVA